MADPVQETSNQRSRTVEELNPEEGDFELC